MKFELGNRVDIADLDEPIAVAVFGRGVYEAWKKGRKDKVPEGSWVVVGVDRKTRTVTLRCESDDGS